ncbi:glycosyltransferase [Piscinibacter sp.]|jgi:glycosyltransferase involved in cell wall biosynthesis|uniref:glycosyltransferase n=1 Tax=Piscinibacter sp. TaxID=1903157 RepID=UPI001B5A24A5|nr:glycosyltransferase [Piscinibacter sp.]MBK7532553.1 glycosyltransferase [Piscinibacter sp.]MBL0091798.1 glycosyltransferase [Piscinibacter sp.]MBP6541353.1 glycosyltransferase [Piscinibacter sp.]HOY34737.1 glycosyltransferase [Piscinibacter sp.]HPG78115.1 glycosyltransferase [Piscinibacter sp.]
MPTPTEPRAGIAAMAQPVDEAPAWAHASGWAQLSGARQTVSCVLPCENSARTLSKLLPILSDTLTECGYPWELIVVDAGSTDGTDGLMQAWCELPGFRFLSLGRPASLADGFEAGILASRGDAVVLLDPALHHSPELIPQMILQWESDARLVYAQSTVEPGRSRLRQWDDAQMREQMSRPDFVLPAQCMELGLLDRRLVDGLLQTG